MQGQTAIGKAYDALPEGGALMTRRGVQAAAHRLVEEGGRFELAQIQPNFRPDVRPGSAVRPGHRRR